MLAVAGRLLRRMTHTGLRFIRTSGVLTMKVILARPRGVYSTERCFTMKVILAQPRGFCAGVVRAIEIVERALQKYGPPVYVRHEIVHNKHVVESLKAKGARFRRGTLRSSAERGHDFQRSRRRQERRRGSGASRASSGVERDLPAGHQSPQPGQALCRPGPQAHPDRPCRPSGGRGHHGPDLRAGDAGADRDRRRHARHSGRHAGRLCHADHA